MCLKTEIWLLQLVELYSEYVLETAIWVSKDTESVDIYLEDILKWLVLGDTEGRDCTVSVEVSQERALQVSLTQKMVLKWPFISDTGDDTAHLLFRSLRT